MACDRILSRKWESGVRGEIFRIEREWYNQHHKPEAVQPWRDAWAQKA